MWKYIYKKSKWLHKYAGLFLILFLIYMSLSGILLNHPGLISGWSVPGWLLPPSYRTENWNRGTIGDFLELADGTLLLAGKKGVWRSDHQGRNFYSFNTGLPGQELYLKAHDLHLHQDIVFLGLERGLYSLTADDRWQPAAPGLASEKIVRMHSTPDGLLVLSASGLYFRPDHGSGDFLPLRAWRRVDEEKITLVELFFSVHAGSFLGLPGQLLFDLVGLIIILLSISAFYTWFYRKIRGWRRKPGVADGKDSGAFSRLVFKYHVKVGAYASTIILIIALTGFFMRPPFLALIAEGSIPSRYFPGIHDPNPWHEKIQNGIVDLSNNKILLTGADGNWLADWADSLKFIPLEQELPIFVMGATVLDTISPGLLKIGSFGGLFEFDLAHGRIKDLLTENQVTAFDPVRPAKYMVTARFDYRDRSFIATQEQGLLELPDLKPVPDFEMPAEINTAFTFPLWNFLFEVHNGRIFKDFIGGFYILLVPSGALFLFLLTISGLYDWLFRSYYLSHIKKRREKIRRKAA